MNDELRQLTFGEILIRALRLVREQWATFLTIQLVLLLPGAVMLRFQAELMERQRDMSSMMLYGAILFFQSIVTAPMAHGAALHATVRAYLGQKTSFRQALELPLSRLQPMLMTNLVMQLLILMGLLMLVVPGILIALWLTFASSIVLLEKRERDQAFQRSKDLVQGNIGTAIGLGVGVLTIAIGANILLNSLPRPAEIALSSLLIVCLGCLQSCTSAVFYVSCRSRDADFNRQVLADELGLEMPESEFADSEPMHDDN